MERKYRISEIQDSFVVVGVFVELGSNGASSIQVLRMNQSKGNFCWVFNSRDLYHTMLLLFPEANPYLERNKDEAILVRFQDFAECLASLNLTIEL